MGNNIDLEWVELLTLARTYGMTIDEVRDFLHKTSKKNAEKVLVIK